MKLAVYDDHRVGIVEDDRIYDVTTAVRDCRSHFPPVYMSRLIAEWATRRGALVAERQRAAAVPLHTVILRAPNPAPLSLVAATVNYRKHIGELGARAVSGKASAATRGFFLKASSSLVGAGERVLLPRASTRRFDHESELAVIIGSTAKNVRREDAMRHVFGYSCLIDVTMRLEPGVAEEERVLRKSFDTFTPMGPWIITADELTEPAGLRNRLWVNDALRQDANTSELIVDVPGLIELISSVMTLHPGDVIATGTPEGVGPISVGDRLRMEIERVGRLSIDVGEADEFAPRRF